MNISIAAKNKLYEVGDAIPSKHIDIQRKDCKVEALESEYILAPGDTSPDGDTVFIAGDVYFIEERAYDLVTGDGVMEAAICDNFIIPKLRPAIMSERYSAVKMVSHGPHLIEEPEGEITEFWPVIKLIER
jgi:hypothetical protein